MWQGRICTVLIRWERSQMIRWFVLWHINLICLFNTKYIYIKYIRFGLVRFYGISEIVGYCDGKLTKIPKRDFIFAFCEDGAGWHLIPYRNKSCSEFFSQADKNWHITWGNNLGPDWPPLAKGSKISHYHTPTRPLNFFPLDNRRIRAYRS